MMRRQRLQLCALVLLLACAACRREQSGAQPAGNDNTDNSNGSSVTLSLTSTAFKEGEAIPVEHTCAGANTSPPLAWGAVPAGTKTIALILDDPDVPLGPFVHWVIYNLPATTTELPADVPTQADLTGGGRQGKNGMLKLGYSGPCPPPGPAHRYNFKLYALNTELTLPAGASKQDLLKAMYGHILGQGQLMGRFKR